MTPGEFGELLGNAGLLHEGVRHVDIELKSDGEFVVHQAGGDEDALRVAESEVAMADGAVAERDVVALGDHDLLILNHRERHEVVSLALEGGGDGNRHGGHHALEVGGAERDLAQAGVTDAVGRLRYGSAANRLGGRQRDGIGGFGHSGHFTEALGFERQALGKAHPACGSRERLQ